MEIVIMPMKKNVPDPISDWTPARCPRCGAECWTDRRREEVAKLLDGILLCTECALRYKETAE